MVDTTAQRGIGKKIRTDDQDDGRTLPHGLAGRMAFVTDQQTDQQGKQQVGGKNPDLGKIEIGFKEVYQSCTLFS